MKMTTIAIDTATFDTLYKNKESFERLVGAHLKWKEFIAQLVLVMDAYYKEAPILARRFNKYIYAADCPKCGKTNGPLHRQKAIIWAVKCDCGKEYIAVP